MPAAWRAARICSSRLAAELRQADVGEAQSLGVAQHVGGQRAGVLHRGGARQMLELDDLLDVVEEPRVDLGERVQLARWSCPAR